MSLRANWLRFARSVLQLATDYRPPATGLWVCLASLAPPGSVAGFSARAHFRTFGAIGFVSHDQFSNRLPTTGYRLLPFGFVWHDCPRPWFWQAFRRAIGFVCTIADVARANWLCLFAMPSRIGSLVTPVPAGAWPLALGACNFTLETPPPIGFVCTGGIRLALFVRASHGLVPQPRPAQRDLASFVHNGVTHRFCRNSAISCGELGILSAISVSLCAALTVRPGTKVVAALAVPRGSHLRRQPLQYKKTPVNPRMLCKNQKLHRNSDRPTSPAPEDGRQWAQDGGPWVATWGPMQGKRKVARPTRVAASSGVFAAWRWRISRANDHRQGPRP